MIDILTKAALDAGQAIMAVHRAGPHVSYKDDCSPVTEADQRAEVIILQALAAHFPQIPVIAEEAVSNGILPETGAEFFLVDPLDGTKEFISGKDDFTVNIALIRNGVPVAGVVYAPAAARPGPARTTAPKSSQYQAKARSSRATPSGHDSAAPPQWR